MSELKPCPFCGGKAKFVHIFENPEKCMVSCRECDGGIDAVFANEEAAAEAWNRCAHPFNEPLTLEQLRKMDREPVWITFFGDEENTPQNRWGILGKSVTGTFGIWEDGLVLKEVDYGKTWLAYRHKPEGSENDG